MRSGARSAFWLVAAALAAGAVATAAAQTPVHLWSERFGGVGEDVGRAIAMDASGNVAIGGSFQSVTDFGDGTNEFTDANSINPFVAKYNSSGTHLWHRTFNGSGQNEYDHGVATDASGNVAVTGMFNGMVDFGGGPLTSAGSYDVFVAKYDANGAHLWSRRFGSTDGEVGLAVAMDAAGNVIVTGQFIGTVDFGGGPLTAGTNNVDIFVAKYSSASGAHMWSKRFGSTQADVGNAVAVDASGNIFVTGSFQGAVDFGGGPLTSAGGQDIFLVKFDPSGAHQWSQRFGSTTSDIARGVAVDGSGNVVITGGFSDVVNFGGAPLTSAGQFDVFLAKYDASGTHQWSKRFGGTNQQEGYGVAANAAGTIAITGYLNESADFGGGLLTSVGNSDIFVAEYNAAGAHQWSQRFGSDSNDLGHAVAVDTQGNVVATGEFKGTVDFGGGPLESAFGFSIDIFLAKFGPNVVGVGEPPSPLALSVSAYPNPSQPGTTVHYAVPKRGWVRVGVYDLRGRRVATLMNEERASGPGTVRWEGRDESGARVSAGLYFLRLEQGGAVGTRKITLLD